MPTSVDTLRSQIETHKTAIKALEKKMLFSRRMPDRDLYEPKTVLRFVGEGTDVDNFWVFVRDTQGVWRARGSSQQYYWADLVAYMADHEIASVEVVSEWKSILGPYLP